MNKNLLRRAQATLPTQYGIFTMYGFFDEKMNKEHVALVFGDIVGKKGILTRVHSECLTGDVFRSLRCDCSNQLDLSLRKITEEKCGVLLYIRQEGRGIGLLNKIRAYELQDKEGMDTFEANKALGFKEDEREYDIVFEMLQDLEVESIDLLTNNPKKINALKSAGISVRKRIPLITSPTGFNDRYLASKKEKGGHMFS